MSDTENWDLIIKPKNKWYEMDLGAVWKYRDLMMLLVRRDSISLYKQTLLGPLWFFIQPVFTIVIYYFMFGRIANISTDGKPALLFYMSGLVCWNYFSECLNGTSGVFINYAGIFGKVYFPRLIVPVATIFSSGIKFFIQLLLFFILLVYYTMYQHTFSIHFSWHIILIPFLILITGVLGMSIGLIISAMTTKYRDLKNLVGYAMQLGLYVTPIIYPLQWLKIKLPLLYDICLFNPLVSVVETFKFVFLGSGTFNIYLVLYSFVFTVCLFFISVIFFNKVEKTFVDTV
jgi:lipopolysaccharide transport system permease protein